LAEHELSSLILDRGSTAFQNRKEQVRIKRGASALLRHPMPLSQNLNLPPESYHRPIEQTRSLDADEAFGAGWRSVGVKRTTLSRPTLS
jgi:hypothetical protein